MHAQRHGIIRAAALTCAMLAALAPVCVLSASALTPQQQAADVKTRIDAIESRLASTMEEFSAAQGDLNATRAAIAENRAQLKRLNASIDTGQSRLEAEAIFLYRTDGNGFTEALFSARSFAEFADRLMALSRIAMQDAGTISRLKSDRAQAAALTNALTARERQQAALVAAVSAKRSDAASALQQQQAISDSLSAQAAAALQAEQNAKSDAAASSAPRAARPAVGGVVWATVAGRSGSYAVLSGSPVRYEATGLEFDGQATWYGNVRPNMGTASGQAFDENEFTCAHKTLPFGTRVAVTFRGRRVIVTVTDRGPYGHGRVIDLTKRAAAVIGLKSAGVGQVHCEVVRPQ